MAQTQLTLPTRHTLLFLSARGWELAWANQESAVPGREALEPVWSRYQGAIPAIVRRAGDGEQVPVGFSFPVREDGVRWKLASYIPENEIVRTVTPEQAAGQCILSGLPCHAALQDVLKLAGLWGVSVGIFGSTALAAATGLPYLHGNSDLDLVLTPGPAGSLRAVGLALPRLEERYHISIDAEAALPRGYYGKLKELLTEQSTVLVKGGPEPCLLSTREVWKELGEPA